MYLYRFLENEFMCMTYYVCVCTFSAPPGYYSEAIMCVCVCTRIVHHLSTTVKPAFRYVVRKGEILRDNRIIKELSDTM